MSKWKEETTNGVSLPRAWKFVFNRGRLTPFVVSAQPKRQPPHKYAKSRKGDKGGSIARGYTTITVAVQLESLSLSPRLIDVTKFLTPHAKIHRANSMPGKPMPHRPTPPVEILTHRPQTALPEQAAQIVVPVICADKAAVCVIRQ